MQIRLERHDNEIDIVEKINVALQPHGLELKDSEEIADDYYILDLVSISEEGALAERFAQWLSMSAEDMRLHCGEMHANEIRVVRAVLQTIQGGKS